MDEKQLKLLKKIMQFKEGLETIPKSEQAYGYKYSPLDVILPIIEPKLKKLGLWYVHITTTDEKSWKPKLTTSIYDVETGAQIISQTVIDDEVALAKMNKFMVVGSALTYYRRYHLVVMLGLLTDEDTDTGATHGKSVEKVPAKIDYFAHVEKLIKKKTPKESITKFYNTYKNQFDKDEDARIKYLIEQSYEKK